MFTVMDDPAFISATAASYMAETDLVLGLALEGEARAYPVKMAWFHHIVNDTVNGRPITVTY